MREAVEVSFRIVAYIYFILCTRQTFMDYHRVNGHKGYKRSLEKFLYTIFLVFVQIYSRFVANLTSLPSDNCTQWLPIYSVNELSHYSIRNINIESYVDALRMFEFPVNFSSLDKIASIVGNKGTHLCTLLIAIRRIIIEGRDLSRAERWKNSTFEIARFLSRILNSFPSCCNYYQLHEPA